MTWLDLDSATLFANLPEPAIIVAVDGRVVAGNPCAAELFELPLPFPQLSVTELLAQPERDRLNPLEWLRKWADSPDAPELDYVYLSCLTSSGAEKQLSVRVARLAEQDSDDADTCYLVTMHDVSRWEERLRGEREAHRIASRVLAISADAVLIVDDAGKITYANASAGRLFDYPMGDMLGLPLVELIPGRLRAGHQALMDKFAHESQSSRLMGERKPIAALTRGGEEIPVEASITRITVHGKPVFSAHVRDLRPRVEAAAGAAETSH